MAGPRIGSERGWCTTGRPRRGAQQNEARSASARSALAAKRRRAVVNPCATRGMVERSGVPLVRRTTDPPSAKRRRTGTVRAFEALRVYNEYNVYNWMYNLYINVQDLNLCLGLRLVGSDGTGSDRGSLRAGRRRAGRSVRPERTVVLPETPRPFGPSFTTGRTL